MFSDTHFHFHHLVNERGLDGMQILEDMLNNNTFFGLDIGTKSEDLLPRSALINNSILRLEKEKQKKASDMIYYTAGIWPDVESIKNRKEEIKKLENSIDAFSKNKAGRLIAIGECGLDHHWNPSGVDERSEGDFNEEIFRGERELFEMQIELAGKMNLPLIIHSRDAFKDSFDCLKNAHFSNGIIHCFSYGLEEAKAFLDEGWYIAFGGAVTYTKKAKLEEMKALLNYVPKDRLLLETDAPYLAPVPFRGQTNHPALIEHTYRFIGEMLEMEAEELSELVDKNIRVLFKI